MSSVLEIDPKIKLIHKDGGFIVLAKSSYTKHIKLKASFFTSQGYLPELHTPTEEDIKDYTGHAEFIQKIQKLINLMEEWDSDRPSTASRYRYSSQDIMNIASVLLNKQPVGLKPAADQRRDEKDRLRDS